MGEGGPRPDAHPGLSPSELARIALAEDLGERGDLTSQAAVPADVEASGHVVSRGEGVLAGAAAADEVARLAGVSASWLLEDGAALTPGQPVCELAGPARAVLAAERPLLNLLCHLSGIATLTASYVEACAPVVVLDSRKTTPGLRSLEKAAVAAGGGTNHRMGLDDQVLVKDNHLALGARPIEEIVRRARADTPGVIVEVEADDLAGVEAAIAAGADWVLLDNMDEGELAEAVALAAGRVRLEASGGMTIERARVAARTGVDAISVGALTHSAPALDLGLDFAAGGSAPGPSRPGG